MDYRWSAPAPTSGLATAGLVLGVLGILTSWLCGLGAILGIIGVVLASVALSRSSGQPGRPDRGLAISGIVTSAVAIVVGVLFFALIVANTDGMNSDPVDGYCNEDRFWQDPDC